MGISPRRVIPPEALRSEQAIDYIPLWRLLEKAEWEAANRETQRLLLQLIRQVMQDYSPEAEAMTLLQMLRNILWHTFWYILVNRKLEQAQQAVQPLLRLLINTVVKTRPEPQPTDDSITSATLNGLPCTDLLTMDYLWLQFSQGHYGFSVQRQLLWWLEDDWEQFTQQTGWINRIKGLNVPFQQTKPGEFPYLQNVFSLVFPSADHSEQFLADCTVELLRKLETCPIRLAA